MLITVHAQLRLAQPEETTLVLLDSFEQVYIKQLVYLH